MTLPEFDNIKTSIIRRLEPCQWTGTVSLTGRESTVQLNSILCWELSDNIKSEKAVFLLKKLKKSLWFCEHSGQIYRISNSTIIELVCGKFNIHLTATTKTDRSLARDPVMFEMTTVTADALNLPVNRWCWVTDEWWRQNVDWTGRHWMIIDACTPR